MDQRLESRLRFDPTSDPPHVPGRFRDRVAAAAIGWQRPHGTVVALRPLGTVLAAAVILAAAVVLRPGLGPGPSTPSPSPTPIPTPLGTGRLEAIVDPWLGGIDLGEAGLSVTVLTGGVSATVTRNVPGAEPVTARIGEISRTYLSATLVAVDACSRVGSQWSCPRPEAFGSGLTLADPVSRWYETWPRADATTVGQLLEGRSGLAPTAPSVSELAELMAAQPGIDWSRDAVIARALAAPRAFPPGTVRAPSDTEAFVLEEVLRRATGLPSSQVYVTDQMPPFWTRFHDQPDPDGLIPGATLDGRAVEDLDPALLALVGDAGGMTASSQDLAEYLFWTWAAVGYFDQPSIDALVDAPHGHAEPLGASGLCCVDGETTVILQTGHALGWSAIAAHDFASGSSIGVVIGRDVPEADLLALVRALTDPVEGLQTP
jgi:hypothetical protein